MRGLGFLTVSGKVLALGRYWPNRLREGWSIVSGFKYRMKRLGRPMPEL